MVLHQEKRVSQSTEFLLAALAASTKSSIHLLLVPTRLSALIFRITLLKKKYVFKIIF